MWSFLQNLLEIVFVHLQREYSYDSWYKFLLLSRFVLDLNKVENFRDGSKAEYFLQETRI